MIEDNLIGGKEREFFGDRGCYEGWELKFMCVLSFYYFISKGV